MFRTIVLVIALLGAFASIFISLQEDKHEAHLANQADLTLAPISKCTAALESSDLRSIKEVIERKRQGGRNEIKYVTPDSNSVTLFRQWVAEILSAAADNDAVERRNFLTFRLQELPANSDIWLVFEELEKRTGGPVIVIRKGEARNLVIEAPHTFFDLRTLEIALDMFALTGARALIINTVHRYSAADSSRDPQKARNTTRGSKSPSDVAHAGRSFFLAAHEAVRDSLPNTSVAQLHGFRDDPALGDIILSASGTSQTLEEIATSLKQILPSKRIDLYPRDVQRLGGTTNRQARASRSRRERFLHVEIGRELRESLSSDESLRRSFSLALGDSLAQCQ